jgi:hypothetical protein
LDLPRRRSTRDAQRGSQGSRTRTAAIQRAAFQDINRQFGLSSAVPEPTTWAMMLVGFGAVGFSMRRRKVGYGRVQAA